MPLLGLLDCPTGQLASKTAESAMTPIEKASRAASYCTFWLISAVFAASSPSMQPAPASWRKCTLSAPTTNCSLKLAS